MSRACLLSLSRQLVVILLGVFLWATPAVAQSGARDLRVAQSQAWYGTQFGILGGLTLASVGLLMPARDHVMPRIVATPDFEQGTWDNFSNFTADASDLSVYASLGAPIVTMAAVGEGHSWGNSLVIYGEANLAALVTNVFVKNLVRRARPYTQGTSPEARAEQRRKGDDAYFSFYSGHASLAFTSASAGSYLFGAVSQSQALRASHWGVSLALASFTAHARVRAGRHYPTDVLVGAAFGLGFGLGVPALQRVRLSTTPAETLAAIGGTALGASVALFLPDEVVQPLTAFNPVFEPMPGGAKFSLSGEY